MTSAGSLRRPIPRYTSSDEDADQVLIWDYLINHQSSLFDVALAFVFLLVVITLKFSISITVLPQPIMLRFGYFNPSLPLVFLLIASFLFPPQVLVYAYLLCIFIWIFSPWPNYVFATFVNWLQHIPVFIIMAQQQPPAAYFEIDDHEDNDDNLEINVIFGHA
ncbi:hypothetical protein POM88_035410 [Heracleum sosnowskyi]|uniref:Uncharacterized protein n=1 Tax=Heracleum sosnowskyi TaxID=360622 RepID=A0AAD8MEP2_9APIA|nr:hypothetical protein POM88_035410 [Heracleum sosnowskyi]